MPQTAQKQSEKWYKANVDIVVRHMSHAGVQPMARAALGVAELIISSECVEAKQKGAKRWQKRKLQKTLQHAPRHCRN